MTSLSAVFLSGTLVRRSLPGSGSPEPTARSLKCWPGSFLLSWSESITSFLLWLLTSVVSLQFFNGNLTWICQKFIILSYRSPSHWLDISILSALQSRVLACGTLPASEGHSVLNGHEETCVDKNSSHLLLAHEKTLKCTNKKIQVMFAGARFCCISQNEARVQSVPGTAVCSSIWWILIPLKQLINCRKATGTHHLTYLS